MVFTNEQILELKESIEKRAKNIQCPVCNGTTFDVVKREAVIHFPETSEHGVAFAPFYYRKCLVNICSNCGNVILFDLDTLKK